MYDFHEEDPRGSAPGGPPPYERDAVSPDAGTDERQIEGALRHIVPQVAAASELGFDMGQGVSPVKPLQNSRQPSFRQVLLHARLRRRTEAPCQQGHEQRTRDGVAAQVVQAQGHGGMISAG